MLTTRSTGQGHPGSTGAKVQGFPASYLPIPTSGTPGAGQTLVLGQLGVLNSPQPPHSIQQQQNANAKQDQVQKVLHDWKYVFVDVVGQIFNWVFEIPQYTTCNPGAQAGQRGTNMQFAPWQFTPQVWTGLQPPTLLAGGNQIFIRGPTQSEMFIQSPQPIQTHNGTVISFYLFIYSRDPNSRKKCLSQCMAELEIHALLIVTVLRPYFREIKKKPSSVTKQNKSNNVRLIQIKERKIIQINVGYRLKNFTFHSRASFFLDQKTGFSSVPFDFNPLTTKSPEKLDILCQCGKRFKQKFLYIF